MLNYYYIFVFYFLLKLLFVKKPRRSGGSMLCRGPDRRGEIYTSLLDNIGITLLVKRSIALRLFLPYLVVKSILVQRSMVVTEYITLFISEFVD